MAVNPITASDLANKGVLGMEDIPGLSAADMQMKFEEVARGVIIPKLNETIEQGNMTQKELEGLVLGAGQVTLEQITRWDKKSDVGINLLHNADWAYSLVNQRGHSGAVSDTYCIDRWIGNGTVTPVAGQYVTLASGTTMTQRMEIIPEALFGKEVTFSIDIYGSTQTETISFPVSADAPANIAYVSCGTIELGFVSGSFQLCGVTCDTVPYIKFTASSSVNVYRVFLEIGKVSHIAETPPQDYINNVLVCKRYFYRNNELSDRLVPGYYTSSATAFAFSFPPTNMRMRPSVAIQGFGIFRGIGGYPTDNGSNGDNLNEFTSGLAAYGILIKAPFTFSVANNTPGVLVFSSDSYVNLSADL